MPNKTLFVIIFIFSLLISSIFLLGHIDQDYFSFYYIGRGVTEGNLMYKDFADNKGPVLYLFFALLYLIFGNNYALALILGGAVLDAVCIFIIFKLLERDFEFKWPKNKLISFGFIAFSILLYKSFSIGTFMGGIYSESVGMLFLLLSIWVLGKKKMFASGIFFAFSVLTRLTYAPFILFLMTLIFIKHKSLKNFINFLLGGVTTVLFFIFLFIYNGELNDFIHNMLGVNIGSLNGSWNTLFLNIINTSAQEFRIFLSLLITLLILFLVLVQKGSKKKKVIILSLYISSFIAVFAGGIGNFFYYHHYFQFNLISIVLFAELFKPTKARILFIILTSYLFASIIASYFLFVKNNENNISKLNVTHPRIKELDNKKYMISISASQLYYFIYDKRAPDKYYQPYFLSKIFNKNNAGDIKIHKTLDRNKLSDTAFVFVTIGGIDKMVAKQYKKDFEKEFKLIKVNEYKDTDSKVEVYESRINSTSK